MNHEDAVQAVAAHLRKLGFRPLKMKHKNANGPDVIAVNESHSFSFEVKTARRLKNGTFQTGPIETRRRSDDYLAIAFSKRSIHIEPMSDHLRVANARGGRSVTMLARLYGSDE